MVDAVLQTPGLEAEQSRHDVELCGAVMSQLFEGCWRLAASNRQVFPQEGNAW